MADTSQAVSWMLETECPFRKGDAVTDYRTAAKSTMDLQFLDRASRSNDIYGQYAVMGQSYSRDGVEPAFVYRVADLLGNAPSLEFAREACRNCPANASGGIAGCMGSLSPDPDDPELEMTLAQAVAPLRADYEAAFLKTTPIWYGLWTSSPLAPEQLRLLPQLLVPLAQGDTGLSHFIRACEIAAERRLRLHVALAPLGHVDLGWSTTFPHCPRCKKQYGQRWQASYTKTELACPVCGMHYVPADTATSREIPSTSYRLGSIPREQIPDDQWEAICSEWGARHRDIPRTMRDFIRSMPGAPAVGPHARASHRRAWLIAIGLVLLVIARIITVLLWK